MYLDISIFDKFKILIGWKGVLAVGLLIFGISYSYKDFGEYVNEYIYLDSDITKTEGMIIGKKETNFSQDQYHPVCAYKYTFSTPQGEITRVAYTDVFYPIGQKIEVEYNIFRPDVSRVIDMDNQASAVFMFIYLIFAMIGLIWYSVNFTRGLNTYRIITNCKLANGRLHRKDVYYNRKCRVYSYEYQFNYWADDGDLYSLSRMSYDSDEWEDAKDIKILYQADNPEEALLVEILPKGIQRLIQRKENQKRRV